MAKVIAWLTCMNCQHTYNGKNVECPNCGAASPYWAKESK